jgi:hypothetical protein
MKHFIIIIVLVLVFVCACNAHAGQIIELEKNVMVTVKYTSVLYDFNFKAIVGLSEGIAMTAYAAYRDDNNKHWLFVYCRKWRGLVPLSDVNLIAEY